jgi:predicted dehydrogenase
MNTIERVLVVGYGYAGRRFTAALDHLRKVGLPVEIAGFCDLDASRVPADGVLYTDIRAALAELSPTVVCVTVNEAAHAAVFAELRSYRRALVLAEKPLAADVGEAERAADSLRHHAFSMNLVERFSPIVRECAEWLRDAGPFDVVRVESFWGKHRISDPRPTIGVLSELIHPLDLMRHLFGPGEIEVVASAGVRSDFSVAAGERLESVDVLAMQNGRTPFIVHSSFAWPARMRRVTAVVRSAAAGLFCLELTFDTPHWDCDRLVVSSVSETGWLSEVHTKSVDRADLPADIRGVGKVSAFIEASLRAWWAQEPGHDLADLDSSLNLQRILGQIELATTTSPASVGYRGSP